jgi:RNA polymerase sigma factor (sigma-70 family)
VVSSSQPSAGPEGPDDAALVRACLAGDDAAWEAVIRRYRRLIYSIPVAYRLPPDLADEIFQRVAVKLLEHLPRLRRVESLASWLATVARHECQALRREGSRFADGDAETVLAQAEAPSPDLAAALGAIEREHALALALERIGEPCRGLLSALYLEEPAPSYQEIASRLGRPVGSLGPTRSRCLAKLQKLYLAGGGPALDGD